MGKNKLKKFADMETIDFVFQYPFSKLQQSGFSLKGRWHDDFFGNNNPIVLELGCGKGEYTIGLASRFPDKNFIGVDIKGARMWTGASEARNNNMTNVAFLRTSIELIESFFAPGEVSEIWITFPDPQMKKTRKRLTATNFLEIYRSLLAPNGIINLKTDSPFLYEYTRRSVELNALPIKANSADLYGQIPPGSNDILEIKTHYEKQWLDRGLTIKYLAFSLPENIELKEPEADDIELDSYRSYGRNYNSPQ